MYVYCIRTIFWNYFKFEIWTSISTVANLLNQNYFGVCILFFKILFLLQCVSLSLFTFCGKIGRLNRFPRLQTFCLQDFGQTIFQKNDQFEIWP